MDDVDDISEQRDDGKISMALFGPIGPKRTEPDINHINSISVGNFITNESVSEIILQLLDHIFISSGTYVDMTRSVFKNLIKFYVMKHFILCVQAILEIRYGYSALDDVCK